MEKNCDRQSKQIYVDDFFLAKPENDCIVPQKYCLFVLFSVILHHIDSIVPVGNVEVTFRGLPLPRFAADLPLT